MLNPNQRFKHPAPRAASRAQPKTPEWTRRADLERGCDATIARPNARTAGMSAIAVVIMLQLSDGTVPTNTLGVSKEPHSDPYFW
jgi:hypothetical protein